MKQLIILAVSVCFLSSGFAAFAQVWTEPPKAKSKVSIDLPPLSPLPTVRGSARKFSSAQGGLVRLTITGKYFTPGGLASILIEGFPGISGTIRRSHYADQSGRIGLMHPGRCGTRGNLPDIVVKATDERTGRKGSTRISTAPFNCRDDGRGE